jgi:sporulation protein YlmC with PRC-barrel domain
MPHARGPDRLNGAVKASDVIGMTVKNYQDVELGKVDDLAVDVESGRVVQVIVSTGGFIGIGDTLSAVPPGALHHDVALKVLHLDADKEKLKGAPTFEMSKWAECCDSNHLSAVYQYYGQEPAFGFIGQGEAAPYDQRKKDDERATASKGQTDGTWDRSVSRGNRHVSIPASRLHQTQKASKLIGTSVKNLQSEKLGTVDNLLLDLPSGRIVAVILSSGGFLGMGDELSAVPPTALRFSPERDVLQLDTSKELLSNAPHFKSGQWPDFAQPSYADKVYRAYRVEPYFTTNTVIGTDNTAANVLEREDAALTPLDQGTSATDVATTAQIRKESLYDVCCG